ncbi:uncharacterized protein LOC112562349 isoform X4 [Pomacea canaliculata]|uniref:uncharacterized protein LOC112562349 isoform X4 n=1 Tax=Pomacea canaliculata TaxID=400727 RepID=UPI000D732192|nr:uncharacterized protein LOC112562349 isoform X4 [Pomacea canaliculata]
MNRVDALCRILHHLHSSRKALKQTSLDDLPTMLPKEQLTETNTVSQTSDNSSKNSGSEGGDRGLRDDTPVASPLHGSPLSSSVMLAAPQAASPKSVTATKSPSPKKPDSSQAQPGNRSLPIHCIIEQMNGAVNFENASSSPCDVCAVELDSYAILPATTPLRDLVRTALVKLGYTAVDAMNAKGAIQLKNWKPLAFDIITDNKLSTVDDILGELTNSATLRIRLSSQPKLSSAEEMKEKLLQLLLTQSHSLLIESGCPIEKKLLMSISKGEASANVSEDLRAAFDSWYNSQIKKNKKSTGGNPASLHNSPEEVKNSNRMDKTSSTKIDDDAQSLSPVMDSKPTTQVTSSSSLPSPTSSSSNPFSLQLSANSSGQSVQQQQQQQQPVSQPHLQGGSILTPNKTRIRTSFDPEHEIPRLQKWFHDNQHPTREQMVRYMNELNSLESRKGRRPLDLTNIIYWFKNARAAQRRANKVLDDSFENEEGTEINNSSMTTGSSQPESPAVPYLPNKNAVYVIPFPYHSPHTPHTHHLLGNSADSLPESYDEPCDLSLKKPKKDPSPHSQIDSRSVASRNKDGGLSENCGENDPNTRSGSVTPSSKILARRSVYMSKLNGLEEDLDVKNLSPCNGMTVFPENLSSKKMGSQTSKESRTNGHHDDRKLLQKHYADVKDNPDRNDKNHLPDIVKEEQMSDDGDDDSVNTDDSMGSRLRIQDDDDDVDYVRGRGDFPVDIGVAGLGSSAVSSTANMAALSLAQMSQPLHIPQLPHQLAMYYQMAPRFYPPPPSHHSQPSVAATAAMVAALNSSARLPGVGPNNAAISNSTNGGHHTNPNHSIPIQPAPHPPISAPHPHSRSSEPRKRRTRVFIDPLTEIPKLEKWFMEDTHPSAYMIDKYTEALNAAEYRQKFPKLEPKNVQLWFKNHRAKVKRMRVGLGLEDSYCDSPPSHGMQNSPVTAEVKDDDDDSASEHLQRVKSENKSPGNVMDNSNEDEDMLEEDAQ